MRENEDHTQNWKLSEDIKTGFTVPKNYFKGIEDDFSLNLIEEKLPKNNVFEIPKTYFEEFDYHIIEKIKPKKGKILNFKKIKLIPVAATIALIIFFGTNFLLNKPSLFLRPYSSGKIRSRAIPLEAFISTVVSLGMVFLKALLRASKVLYWWQFFTCNFVLLK